MWDCGGTNRGQPCASASSVPSVVWMGMGMGGGVGGEITWEGYLRFVFFGYEYYENLLRKLTNFF